MPGETFTNLFAPLIPNTNKPPLSDKLTLNIKTLNSLNPTASSYQPPVEDQTITIPKENIPTDFR
eukprot:5588444-Ditylum_brightwellii.AAC.1